MLKVWKFLRSAVELFHKFIMSLVHLRELVAPPPPRRKQVPFSLFKTIFGY